METLKMLPIRVQITAILRKAIYSGEYKGGDELSLTDIAAKMGISRTPVREAFQVLESEGLITLRMNKGAIVNNIDRKFVKDIFEMRILMESEAAYRAAKNGMTVDGLLQRLNALRECLDAVNVADYEALNLDIHQSIWRAADNHQLTAYLMDLWNGPSIGRGENAAQHHYFSSTDEHIRVLTAIGRGDAEEAKQAMACHITRSMDNILTHYPEE